MVLAVLAVVEIDEHRGVGEDADEQVAEVAGRVGAQHLVLAVHHAGVPHLAGAGGEVPVPEQGELLLEGAAGRQHAPAPPRREPLRLHGVGAQAVEERVDDGLQPARLALGQHRDAHRRPRLAGDAHRLGPALRERVHPRVPDRRGLEGGGGVVDGGELDEGVDGGLGGHRGQPLDLGRRRPEAGALDEVRGPVVAPVGGGDGRQVVDPRVGARLGGEGRDGAEGRGQGGGDQPDEGTAPHEGPEHRHAPALRRRGARVVVFAQRRHDRPPKTGPRQAIASRKAACASYANSTRSLRTGGSRSVVPAGAQSGSRCTVSGVKAGMQTAMYSAPPGSGLE